MLKQRLEAVEERVGAACHRSGRDRADITLVAVTKIFPASVIREAYDIGLRDFGENYVQEFSEKAPQLGPMPDARFHLIGHLQSNKAKKAGRFDVVHSIDSAGLIEKLDDAVSASGRHLDMLVQVDLAGEATKHGAREDELGAIFAAAGRTRAVRLKGLMLLPPAVEDPDAVRPFFQALRDVRGRLPGSVTIDSVKIAEDRTLSATYRGEE